MIYREHDLHHANQRKQYADGNAQISAQNRHSVLRALPEHEGCERHGADHDKNREWVQKD